jgi:hypothetical protein
MKRNRLRQLHEERRMAGEVTDAESEAVTPHLMPGYNAENSAENKMAEQFTPRAVIARQRQIIVLLNGVRALNIALLVLFVVFGIWSVLLLDALNETRDTTRDHSQEQRLVLCDIYTRLDEIPPDDLGCR